MERKLIDYEMLKAHIEERIAYYTMEMDRMLGNEEYDCCDFSVVVGAHSAYVDMLWNLEEAPF